MSRWCWRADCRKQEEGLRRMPWGGDGWVGFPHAKNRWQPGPPFLANTSTFVASDEAVPMYHRPTKVPKVRYLTFHCRSYGNRLTCILTYMCAIILHASEKAKYIILHLCFRYIAIDFRNNKHDYSWGFVGVYARDPCNALHMLGFWVESHAWST